MIITCEACSTRFVLDDALIKPEGSKVKCSKCRHVFTAFPLDGPEIEIPPDLPKPQENDISGDEPEIQDDFNIDSDSYGQDADLEDADIDFSEIEFDEAKFEQNPPERQTDTESVDFQYQDIEGSAKDFDEDGLDFETADFEIDEPELDFQDNALKLDAQDFEFEKIKHGSASGPISVSSNSDMADIEISFAQDDDTVEDLELEELSLDMDDPVAEKSSIDDLELDDLELDTEKNETQKLEFDDDNRKLSPDPEETLIDLPIQQQEEVIEEQADIEYESSLSNDVDLESDDSEEPDDQEADEEIEQTAAEQDKFAEYDKVLEQDTEPQDASITIPDPEVEESTYPSENLLAPTDDEINTTIGTSMGQEAFITTLSEQSVRQKRRAKEKKGLSLPVKILLVLVLLILAAYVAIIRLGVTIPVVSDIQIPFITEWLAPNPKQPPQPPLDPIPDEPSINGRFVSNKSAGDLFVVTGRIKNPSNIAVSYIQVKGTLMTKDNTKAKTLIAYCGNIIPEETLMSGNISDITKQMDVRQGNQNTNVTIKPGASVMFMLVFSNLPEDLSNFTVAVQGFESAQE
ncbi:MAG: Znf/thioredoxin put protein [Thermodesulfobacteriota bacterium]|nr:Znf/thioredoxin put protein [Thermodesulfobacteriota bacterium]